MSVNPIATKDKGKDRGIQRDKLPVYEFYSGTGDHTENFPIVMRELVFSNDSLTTNVSIQLLGPAELNTTFVLLPNEVLDERLPAFTTLVITGGGVPWRFYVRTGEVE